MTTSTAAAIPVFPPIIDSLKELGLNVKTHEEYMKYRGRYFVKHTRFQGKAAEYLHDRFGRYDLDECPELWVWHEGYVIEIELAPTAGKCGDCGRALPANCPGAGGLCLKTHETKPINCNACHVGGPGPF